MKKIVAGERANRGVGALVVALLTLAGAGCFRNPDPNKLTCDKASACPSGYYCAIDEKRCVAGAAPSVDSSTSMDGTVDQPSVIGGAGGGTGHLDGASSPLDGIIDRAPAGGGAGGMSSLDLGAGGIIVGAGGAGGIIVGAGGSDGATNVIDGGVGGIDGPHGSGGTPIVDAPLAGAGGSASGGVTAVGGQGGSGGASSPGSGGSGAGGTTTLSTGATCQTDGQCTLGFCVDGVCCNSKCNGQCQACAETGTVGTCTTVKSGAPRGTTRLPCSGTDKCQGTCDGSSPTTCKMPNNETLCKSETCSGNQHTVASYCDGTGTCPTKTASTCSSGTCATDGSGTCLGSCTSTSCPSTQYCDSTTGDCTTKKGNGTGNTCATGAQCTSGFCASDGICCPPTCTGQCQTCNNSSGTCTRVASGQPVGGRLACTNSTDTTCGGRCDNTSDNCSYPGSTTSCGAAPSCTTPDYGSSIAGACNSQGSCTSTTTNCTSSGQACIGGSCKTKIASNSATTCQVNGQCQSGHCCSGTGTCRDFNNDSSNCGGCGIICQNGQTCNGSGSCACPSGTADCDGTGCVDILSSDTHCGSSCTSCYSKPGYSCSGGSCACSGKLVGNCGCLGWDFNNGSQQGWIISSFYSGTLCDGMDIGTGNIASFDGTQGLFVDFSGSGCAAVIEVPVCSNSSTNTAALNGLAFSAEVLFEEAFPGSIELWDNAAYSIGTNVGGSTIPANTWTNVTATISDSGSASNEFGIRFKAPFDSTWSGRVWIDKITLK